MTGSYTIAPAEPSDVPALPGIELAAARLLAGHAPEPVLAQATSLADLEAAQAAGRLWVARAGDAAVGFAHVTLREPGVAHLEELDVHPAHGRQGIGRRLVLTVCDWAARQGYEAVTLTTFRDVPFNMPFYRTLGFVAMDQAELSPAVAAILDAEARSGLARERRVGMRRASAA
jgi:GNAT superfamily N-acetyltransferase